jgi:DNA repair protein RadD
MEHSMTQLRPYQERAKAAFYHHLRTRDDNPAVVLPTASGKTHVMASTCKDAVQEYQGRVLILAHVQELLLQAADKLQVTCPDVDYGIFSAGLDRSDTHQPVIIAGIQSIYREAALLGPRELILVDEAHMIPPGGDGMYRRFLAGAREVNPQVRVVGFTATPFRLRSGLICAPEGILNRVCYEARVPELIRDGYLCPLISKAGTVKVETARLRVRGGEFLTSQVEALMDNDALVVAACGEIVDSTRDRHAVLIFASGVRHGEHIRSVLGARHGIDCGFITGQTPHGERAATLARFRGGDLKFLCNVNVLTTGYDAPHIDCVALVRPTLSPGLYYQMVGRGFRVCPGKEDCLVLDFGGNVLRHGPVDQIRIPNGNGNNGGGPAPAKECPNCRGLIASGYGRCPQCGHEFTPPERRNHAPKASDAAILSRPVITTRLPVLRTTYSVHHRRESVDASRTMRVDYQVDQDQVLSEWVCPEHEGYARQKAEGWWQLRSTEPVPRTALQAVAIAQRGGLATTNAIRVRTLVGDAQGKIIGHELGRLPAGAPEAIDIEPGAAL